MANRHRISGVLLAAIGLTAIAGCTFRSLPAVPEGLADQAQIPGMKNVRCWGDGYRLAMQRTIVDALIQRQAAGLAIKEIDILTISGGGADGAYGAGLLCGWTEAGDRPTFDAVAGISTGALIAPFAFLGPEYDKPLRAFYTRVSTRDILTMRPLLVALFSDAAADTAPLVQLVGRAVTPQVLQAVAREHARGRRLFIGTVNLDAQRPVVWDMGAIAASGSPQALELFRKVIVASASVPGAFPPQYFDVEVNGQRYQEMHVDGGTMNQVFHFGEMLDFKRLRTETKALPADLPRKFYLIRNSLVRPEWADVKPRVTPIAGRAVFTLIKANAAGDLNQIYLLCKIERMDFNLSYIPDEYRRQETELFDKTEMQRLFDVGFRAAKARTAWKKAPPGVVDSDLSTTKPEAPPARKDKP